RSKGLDAYGVPANNFEYRKALSFRNSIREKIANIKAFLEVSFNIKPHFLGEKIPITGDSRLSYD
ncbi:MAG: hypothetical protein KDK36_20680, partial [Leptospiraceae bacterium]|nr:hypothetical protein [Leptospiraceae bacterium]